MPCQQTFKQHTIRNSLKQASASHLPAAAQRLFPHTEQRHMLLSDT